MATTKHTTPSCPATKDAAVHDDDLVIQHALRILESRVRVPGKSLSKIDTAADWFRLRLGDLPYEAFAVAWLNREHRLIAFCELFNGTLDECTVYMYEVVRSALEHNASACIFAHNHPSGGQRASAQDIDLTTRLVAALHLVRVKVLDHFVVTAGGPPFSMARHHMVACARLHKMQTRYSRKH